ncbi:MAG: O-antigen ligase family protein [bacterium]
MLNKDFKFFGQTRQQIQLHLQCYAERFAYGFFLITLAFSQISIAGTQIALAFCLLFFVLHAWINRTALAGSGVGTSYVVFVLALALSSVLSEYPWASLFNLRKLGLIIILYLTMWLINGRRRLLWSHAVLALSLAIMGIFEIVRSTLEDTRLRWATHGITVTYGVVIMMSLLMLLAVRSSFRQELHAAGRSEFFLEKFYFTLLLLVIAVAFILAGVRSALLGLSLGSLILAALKERRLLIYFFLTLLLVIVASPPDLQERLIDMFDVQGDKSVNGRLLQWQTGWRIFVAQPWLGWGWRDLVELYPAFAPAGADLGKHPFHIGHVHNNFLQMAITGGSIGLGAFVWLLVTIGKKLYLAWRHIPDSYLRDTVLGAFCAFIGYLLASFFDWSFADEEITMALWLIVGLGFAAERMARIEQYGNVDIINKVQRSEQL